MSCPPTSNRRSSAASDCGTSSGGVVGDQDGTFDGITYNALRVMEEVLAIKPDICFLWDEAWYAFATAVPFARQRTAMDAAAALLRRLTSPEYRAEYDVWRADMADVAESQWVGAAAAARP
jgi:hypothetical protein